MYQPLAAAVIACRGRLAAARAHAGAGGLGAPAAAARAEAQPEDVWLIRTGEGRLRAAARRRACATPGWCAIVALAITVPALALAFAVGSDFMPELDEGALLLQTMLPAGGLARRGRPAEPPRRGRAARLSRGGGRRAPHRPRRAHRGSDAAHPLGRAGRPQDGRERVARGARGGHARAVEKVPGVSVLFTTPLGMRIDEGLGGTPADLSVRIFGPDLDTLAATRRAGPRPHGAASTASPTCARSGSPACRSCASPWTAPRWRASASRPATSSARSASASSARRRPRCGSASAASTSWCASPDHRAERRRRHPRPAGRRPRRHAHPARASSPRSSRRSGAAAIRREAGSRRIAVEASVAGRDLGSTAARGARAAGDRSSSCPPATSSTSAAGWRARQRAARSLTRRHRRRAARRVPAALPRAGLARRDAGHPRHAAGCVRRRHPRAAASPARRGTCRRSSA